MTLLLAGGPLLVTLLLGVCGLLERALSLGLAPLTSDATLHARWSQLAPLNTDATLRSASEHITETCDIGLLPLNNTFRSNSGFTLKSYCPEGLHHPPGDGKYTQPGGNMFKVSPMSTVDLNALCVPEGVTTQQCVNALCVPAEGPTQPRDTKMYSE